MKYGQGFDNMVSIFVICLISVALTYGLLRYLQRLDSEPLNIRRCSLTIQACLCVISCESVCFFWKLQNEQKAISLENIIMLILLSTLAACLLSASIMDLESYMIYNYVWWVSGIVVMVLLCRENRSVLWELVVYVLLQEFLFCRMYGRADCHAFVICAILEASWGMNMQGYLIHMLLAFILLAVVQGIACNIGRDGNLKQPVAFLPYITVSFWGIAFAYAAVY